MQTVLSKRQVASVCGVTVKEVNQWVKEEGLKAWGTDIYRGTLIRFLKQKGKPLGALAHPVRILLLGMTADTETQLTAALQEDPVTLARFTTLDEVENDLRLTVPDFILIDLDFGRENAFSLAQKIRDTKALSTVFVYAFLNSADLEVMGPWGLFAENYPKPVEVSFMAHSIRQRTMYE